MNNVGIYDDIKLLVILNDNDMSISPPVGALNRYFARLMSGKFYATAKNVGKTVLRGPILEIARRFEEHAKRTDRAGNSFRGIRIQLCRTH